MKTKYIFLILFLSLYILTCSAPTIKPITINVCNGNYSVFLYPTSCDDIPHEISISAEELNRLKEIKDNSTEECIPVTIKPLSVSEALTEGYLKSSINIWCSI